jgi:hypothetical protein
MSMLKIGSDGRAMCAPVLAAFHDEQRGLMWAAADVSEKSLNFADAEKAVANFRAAGFSDWRLPTIEELESLRDRSRFNPAADPELGLKSDWYWSSTPDASAPGECAWIVGFYYGYATIHNRDNRAFVRAVRSARASQ